MTDGNGWIKLHRRILTNDFLRWDPTCFSLFIKILLSADSKDGTYTTGRSRLAEMSNLPQMTAYKALKRLEKQGMIQVFSNNRRTTIRICNWSTFQQDGNNKGTAGEQPGNTIQEIRNKKLTIVNSEDDPLKIELTAFVEMRKTIRKPITEYGLKQIRTKLERLYPQDTERQKQCLNQSIENSWQGVFELKHQPQAARKASWT